MNLIRRASFTAGLTIAALALAACGGATTTPTPKPTPIAAATPAPGATEAPTPVPPIDGVIPSFDLSGLVDEGTTTEAGKFKGATALVAGRASTYGCTPKRSSQGVKLLDGSFEIGRAHV